MSLRLQAAADARAIVQNTAEFGWAITVTSPSGEVAELLGLATHIGQTIDPQTGMLVSGMRASVALPLATLSEAGIGIPKGVGDSKSKPWLVTVADVDGALHTYKVQETSPDRAIGLLICFLENYKT